MSKREEEEEKGSPVAIDIPWEELSSRAEPSHCTKPHAEVQCFV